MTSTTLAATRRPQTDVIDAGIVACAVGFVIVLAVSAVWDPSIRVLHAFESVPYAAAAGLASRKQKMWYFLGATSGLFWLWTASTLTTFVRNGFERVWMLVTTGQVDRWDQFIAAPAAIFTAGLALSSMAGYLRLPRKAPRDLALFIAVLAAVVLFFLSIFWLFAPHYLELYTRLWR